MIILSLRAYLHTKKIRYVNALYKFGLFRSYQICHPGIGRFEEEASFAAEAVYGYSESQANGGRKRPLIKKEIRQNRRISTLIIFSLRVYTYSKRIRYINSLYKFGLFRSYQICHPGIGRFEEEASFAAEAVYGYSESQANGGRKRPLIKKKKSAIFGGFQP